MCSFVYECIVGVYMTIKGTVSAKTARSLGMYVYGCFLGVCMTSGGKMSVPRLRRTWAAVYICLVCILVDVYMPCVLAQVCMGTEHV